MFHIKKKIVQIVLGDSFVYRLVNRVLRTSDPDLIHPYRFFINALYDDINHMNRRYCDEIDDLVVYRGQGLSRPEFHYICHKVGQLLTLSSFTSTTVEREMALEYAQSAVSESTISVLFEFHLHSTISNTRPYAYVAEFSAIPSEYEVLLTCGIIFRLVSVTYDQDKNVWIIVGDFFRQQNHDIKSVSPDNDEDKLNLTTFGADICQYHKEKSEKSIDSSINTTSIDANDGQASSSMNEFIMPNEFPPIFDQFNGNEEDDGVNPILSTCIREIIQQSVNRKTNVSTDTLSVKEEADIVRQYIEYFYKLYEGRWRKSNPLMENVQSSVIPHNTTFQGLYIPPFLKDFFA